MNQIPDPENLLDVVTILAVTAMIAVPSWLAALKSHKGIQEVKAQVVNGHTSPMRADLDRVIEAIDRLAHDITAIRRDLAAEEDRRRDHVAELRDELHRKVNDLHQKFGSP